jgi:NNP family nitrate/nitrite transporter-like MFS transporter
MQGRLWIQTAFLAFEGIFVIVLAKTGTLAGAITSMVFFSVFVQASEGSTYGIVPYVDEENLGAITGIVGAGGNVGAVCFAFTFRELGTGKKALMIMGGTAIASSLLSFLIKIEGHDGLLFKEKSLKDVEEAPTERSGLPVELNDTPSLVSIQK